MPLPFCVYILFSLKDQLLYTGFTTNLEKRVQDHNSGHVKSTASRGPLHLVFCEFYLFKTDARKREGYFKTSMGRKAIKLMLASSLVALGYKSSTLKKLQIISDDS